MDVIRKAAVILIFATLVSFVSTFAGWLVHLFESVRQDLSGRNEDYRRMRYQIHLLTNVTFTLASYWAPLPCCLHVSKYFCF